MDASRVIVCSPTDALLFELSPDELWACDESLEINGPHQLDIVTTRVLTKEQRIVVFDEGNHAHEYVVASEDREHANGSIPYGTYKCPWSLQHDARLWKVDTDVGITTPVQASVALEAVLSGTNRWVAGTVTLATTGSAELHRMSGWKALETVIGIWGGEVDAEVTVSTTGITQRRVMLYAQMGNQTAKRRFDYQRDLESIQRHVLSDDVACRIIPLGKGSTNEYDVEEKVDITSVNDDVEWLQNDESAAIYRMKGPNGSYEYPVVYVENGDMETPADLKAWGLSVLEEYTVPKVEYEMEVTYLYHKDYNPHGVNLGDVIQCVDHGFGDTPLRLEARVTGMKIDRLDRSRSTVKITNVKENRSLTSSIASVASLVNEIAVVSGGTAEYLNHLLDNLNKEINARGGYVYITDGQGLRTYDKAVTDPLTGYTADYVTEMKGGSLRFAHEKENGEWKWTTVITPEGYLGLAATIAQITSGLIQNYNGTNYWNLDTGEIRLTTATYIGDGNDTIQDIIDTANATITNVDVEYAQGTSATVAPTGANIWSTNPPTWEADKYIWSRTATTTGTGNNAVTTYTTPVMISGKDGGVGRDGVGIVSIREQYYLSTSNQYQLNGSWSYNQPTWTTGTHIWTRSVITWDTNPQTTTYTEPILAAALTQANKGVYDLDQDLQQQGIFNRLTNNGQWQGFFTSNGNYYINATYIQSGTLSADLIKGGTLKVGGSNNTNGILQVFDASSNEICRLDNNGAVMTGEISMQATCDIWDGSESSPAYLTADVRIGLLKFTDPDIYAGLIGANMVRNRYCLPGLSISGINTGSGTSNGNLQIIPPISNSANILYSPSNSIRLRVGPDNAIWGAGMFTGTSGSSITGCHSTYIHVDAKPNVNEDEDITLRATGEITFLDTGVTFGYIAYGNVHSGPRILIHSSSTYTYGSVTIEKNLTVQGTKSRVVNTDNYSDRLLYCYETPSPIFGDIGSAVIGNDGVCVVSIDDVFSECARTDMAYQVFLQKCGQGDLWVSEKTATHFVVEGTPSLPFDWEVKAHQTGYESERLEDASRRNDFDDAYASGFDVAKTYDTGRPQDDEEQDQFDAIYLDELLYVAEIESLY